MSKSCEHAISIEVQHEMADVARTLEANEKVAPVYEKLVKKLAAKYKKCERVDAKEPDDHDRVTVKPKIQRVPTILREHKKSVEYYEPRWISVGPIHHGKPKLQHETQYKLALAEKFIEDSGLAIEALYAKINENIQELKNYFDEDVIKKYDDVTLSWILFFDGCSILQLISSCVNSAGELKTFKIKSDQIALAQHDLFLLENQIPFSVLKLLIGSSSTEKCNKLKESVKKFVRYNVMAPNKYTEDLYVEIDNPREPAHLLDLLRSAILQDPKEHHRTCCGSLKDVCNTRNDNKEGEHSFRSVQDLKAAGIKMKKSGSCSLRDITFKSLCFAGWLRLPAITVDDSTCPKFLNLIAYEMCPDNIDTDYGVTSYICFLDSLIDDSADVKDLRSAHILQNHLGSDKEVAKLFNEIATDLVSIPVYEKVKTQIQNHYKSTWRTWMAQVYHDHFSSPWTIAAFLAAVLALGMSGVQTWFTIPSD